jgi:formylglycine-generating enzyme required for sulfatase activity/TolA-binding protein
MTVRNAAGPAGFAVVSVLVALLALAPGAGAQSQAVDAATQHWQQGLAYRNAKQFAQAIQEFQRSIAAYPTSAAYNDMGQAWDGLGRYDDAKKAYLKALELKPTNGAAHHNLGALYYLRYKDYPKAEAAFREAVRLDPNSENSNMGLGLALSAQGRYGDALMPFANAAHANAANPKPLLHLGNVFAQMGQLNEARQVLGKLQTINQVDAKQLEQIIAGKATRAAPVATADPAAAQIQEGDKWLAEASRNYKEKKYAPGNEAHGKALQAYKKAVELNPKSFEAYWKLGDFYHGVDGGSRDDLEAIDIYKQALGLEANSAYVHTQLALSYLKLDRFAEAIQAAKRANQLAPGEAVTSFNLGFIYAAMGHFDDVRKIQSQLLGKDQKLAQQLQDAIDESTKLSSNIERPRTFANPKIALVAVKPGSFQMGATKSAKGRPVTIGKAYFIGKYPVTQAQYQMVMGENPSLLKNCGDCPVDTVSWNDAQAFIARLNSLEDGYRYRLPSEAEWEFAYRAGGAANAWPSGDIGWSSFNSDGKAHPVGQKPANALGVFDINGAIEEWCMDYFVSDLASAPTDGGAWLNPEIRRYRSLRGNSYRAFVSEPVTHREGLVPWSGVMYAGFRVAADRTSN